MCFFSTTQKPDSSRRGRNLVAGELISMWSHTPQLHNTHTRSKYCLEGACHCLHTILPHSTWIFNGLIKTKIQSWTTDSHQISRACRSIARPNLGLFVNCCRHNMVAMGYVRMHTPTHTHIPAFKAGLGAGYDHHYIKSPGFGASRHSFTVGGFTVNMKMLLSILLLVATASIVSYQSPPSSDMPT